MTADLLGLFEAHGLKLVKKTGKEWGAPCPACGGTDRCMVRPDDHDGRGGYHCRQCGTYGDNIQFLRDFEDMSWRGACERCGVAASLSTAALPKPPRRAAGVEPFAAAPSIPPAELWSRKASAFLAWAHQHLLDNAEQLAWLAKRGLPLEAVKRYRLGWNPGEKGKSCLIRPRAIWGLPLSEPKDGERPKTTFWIPRGLVIPMLASDGSVLRLRIRRPEADRANFREETKYYVIPGSCMDALILRPDARAFVVVESELDALMLGHVAGDLAGAVSVMTATVKNIEAGVLAALFGALCVLVALDFDKAGAKGWERWQASLPRAKRWPAPVGKDPGEAFEQGANLRAWVLAGLPPALSPGLLPVGMPVHGGKDGENGGQNGDDRQSHSAMDPSRSGAAHQPDAFLGQDAAAPSAQAGFSGPAARRGGHGQGQGASGRHAADFLTSDPTLEADLRVILPDGPEKDALFELIGLLRRHPIRIARIAPENPELMDDQAAWGLGLDYVNTWGNVNGPVIKRVSELFWGVAHKNFMRVIPFEDLPVKNVT